MSYTSVMNPPPTVLHFLLFLRGGGVMCSSNFINKDLLQTDIIRGSGNNIYLEAAHVVLIICLSLPPHPPLKMKP